MIGGAAELHMGGVNGKRKEDNKYLCVVLIDFASSSESTSYEGLSYVWVD